jgi:hypothetical protein
MPPVRDASAAQDPDVPTELLSELGLLPSPDALARYHSASPDIPGAITGWIDAQITHRMARERAAALAREARLARGQHYSAAITVIGLLCATAVGLFGNPVVASIIAVAAVGGPTTAAALARPVPTGCTGGGPPGATGR